ncbi:TrgA family protein [Jannaschia sp. M317]|uniref:TrgA family protein n=1 Tax=Jannaschia sp. M317 TaxID=2867011 RepID=UPI0021A5770A|nr:TrgA family protein [Jannaschia sp. M317]UWQ16897.1 TrgA family protein [Jannaschia sp. M317]
MPTPAKLVCAVLFAVLGWWTGETIVREVLPEGVVVGRFREWIALGGLIVGWKYIGRVCSGEMNKGTTMTRAVTAGIGGAFVLMLLGLVLHSFSVMIIESLDSKYTEVGPAAAAWMEYLWEDAQLIVNPIVLGTFFGGAAVVGLIGGIVGRTLR